jgi:hypothetical protein
MNDIFKYFRKIAIGIPLLSTQQEMPLWKKIRLTINFDPT